VLDDNVRPVRKVSSEQQLLSARRCVRARAIPFAGRIFPRALGATGFADDADPIAEKFLACFFYSAGSPEAALVGAWTAG